MNDLPMLDSIENERLRRLRSRANNGEESEASLKTSLSPFSGTNLAEKTWRAYEYAKSVDYEHGGLSSAAYLAHPVSVACLALKVVRPPDENAAVLALLHNLLEVSKISEHEIAQRFGNSIAVAIRQLTVDRSQSTHEYTSRYYQALQSLPKWGRVIKVLDKLDNLFILCINPDAHIRAAYLADIEEFVLPMANADLPHLMPYLKSLVADCRRVGFLDVNSLVFTKAPE
jgi:(p)ppGpp synthase/HD superfamily hydrolase